MHSDAVHVKLVRSPRQVLQIRFSLFSGPNLKSKNFCRNSRHVRWTALRSSVVFRGRQAPRCARSATPDLIRFFQVCA